MKTRLAAVALLGGLLLGCDESDQFVILQNQVPKAGCVIGTERSPYRGEGWLDVAMISPDAPFGYELYPLLESRLPAIGEEGAEPNRLFVRRFRVTVEAPDAPAAVQQVLARANPALLDYEERWAGTLEPGGGLLAASVTVVPGELARQIRASGALDGVSHGNLLVRVRAIGDRTGGTLESREFTYPVRLCAGCLAQVRACPYAPTNKGHACNLAQDEPVDCCVQGNQIFCPSIAPSDGK